MRLRRTGALTLFAFHPLLLAVGPAMETGERTSLDTGNAVDLQAQADLTVSPEWLASHLDDPDLVLLHVDSEDGYQAGHLPGARLITLGDISLPVEQGSDDLRLEMPSPEVLRQAFEERGVSDDSRIVVYFGTDWVTPTTRVVFTLDYLGLGGQTSVLNGGMPAWSGAGHSVSTETPEPITGHLTPHAVRSDLIVDADFAQHAGEPGGPVLVDARDLEFYDGTRPTNDREGHIPGAFSVPFSTAMNDDLQWDRNTLAEAFEAAGIRKGDTVVAYCHIGQQATTIIFGARLLGHPVKLYDGSFQDWAQKDRPVEKGIG